VSQMEPIFCHCPETLRLVQLVRLLDESLRRRPPEGRDRLQEQVRDLIDRGREIARENFLT